MYTMNRREGFILASTFEVENGLSVEEGQRPPLTAWTTRAVSPQDE